jgi:hypothetical protein
MQTVKVPDRRKSKYRLTTLALALMVLVVVGLPARAMARLYDHLDLLSAGIRGGHVRAAAPELEQITSFYSASRTWGLQWLADYLFADAFLQRAAVAYIAQDYPAVVKDLENRVDDPRAAYLLGCAKFRIAQRRYREIGGNDSASLARKKVIVQEVMETINPDFERAVRADPNDSFAYKWNYDLTSSADAIRRALEIPRVSKPPELEQRIGTESPVRRRRG